MHVRIRWQDLGGHVHLRVFVGATEDRSAIGATLAAAGTLALRGEEWARLQRLGPLLRLIEPAAAACGVTGEVVREG